MSIRSAALLIALAATSCVTAQTLVTIDKEPISVSTFVSAYKRAGSEVKGSPLSPKEYLELFVASRLKIREARARGLDTLPQMRADLQGLREQILPSFLDDGPFMDSLVKEAFERSRKDIELQHIFVSAKEDSATAKAEATTAYDKLQKGAPFATVARAHSDDPQVAMNGGAAGFITVFSLPYAIENLVYTTPPGKLAPLYRSLSGYHIFRNAGERKAVGRVRAAQILLAFPPGADTAERAAIRRRADSLYSLLQSGADFGTLATQWSNDVISAASNGQLPEFGVGEYDALFENTVYGLPLDAVSKPFETAHGWHIVKRLAAVAPAASPDKKAADMLREKVAQSDRMNVIEQTIAQRVYAQAPLSPLAVEAEALWRSTDSAFHTPGAGRKDYTLLHLGKQPVTFGDWITYARDHRVPGKGNTGPYAQLFWNDFVPKLAVEYYKANLEDFNPAFAQQLDNLRDGSLFFEIMQRQVWDPAQSDTTAIRNYYNTHRNRYTWKKSADAVVFYASDTLTANQLRREVLRAPANWKVYAAAMGDKVVTDSNRFELDALPNSAKVTPRNGMVTAPLIGKNDNTVSFALFLRVYPLPEPRSFEAAKGLVIADYGEALDRAWIAELKKKYSVQVNENAWRALLKNGL